MSKRNRCSVLILELALVLAAVAVPHAAEWKLLQTPHFELYTTESAGAARETLRFLENIYDFFDKFSQLTPDPPGRVRVVMFSSEKEFAPYRPGKLADAYYMPGMFRETIVLGDSTPQAQNTVIHEYTHLLVNQLGGDYPLWLNEGLAEFFATFERTGKEVRIGRVSPGRLYVYRTDRPLSIARLLDITALSPEFRSEDTIGMVYAEGWALTHMIMVGDRFRPKSSEFLRAVSTGSSAVEAFATVYGRTLNQIEGDLADHFRGGTIPLLLLTLTPFVPPAIATVPITEVDARVALAELTLGVRDARPAFDAIGSGATKSVAELEARAEMALRYGQIEEAKSHLNAAVQAGSELPAVRTLAAAFEARAALQQNAPDRAVRILAGVQRPPRIAAFMYYEALAHARIALTDYALAVAAATSAKLAAKGAVESAAATALATRARGPSEMQGVVSGRLKNMNCDGPQPVLEVTTAAGGLLKLVIDDRNNIAAPSTTTPQLSCGAQDRAIRVGYSFTDPPAGIDGRVRLIDLR